MDKRKEFEKAAEKLKDGIKHSTKDLKEAASEKIEGFRTAAEKQGEKLRTASEDAWSQAQDWQHRGIQLIRENPVQAVAIAFAVGVVVGMLIRK
jgi:ElaB/YqjD/DUF883 family membrane-anchored ribosome-binding protein